MALTETIGKEARKLFVPAAATLAGAGAGLVLTRKSVRNALPDLGDKGIGNLTDDLRTKLGSVVDKGRSQLGSNGESGTSGSPHIDPRELEQRRRERDERRSKRRARS